MNSIITTALILCLGLSVSSRAQLSEEQTKAFPLGPPSGKGWFAIKNFTYVGDYLYTSTNHRYPTQNTYLTGNSYNDYDYFLYTGVRGKRLNIYMTYDGTRPTTAGGCEHTHLNYGAKGYYTLSFRGTTYSNWIWLAGGTQSGIWNANTQTCRRSVVNNLSQSQPIFGWGTDFIQVAGTTISPSAASYIDHVIFVIAAPTHGVGDCDPVFNPQSGFSFKACLDAAYVSAWTTPL
jgi:hypothetical protein